MTRNEDSKGHIKFAVLFKVKWTENNWWIWKKKSKRPLSKFTRYFLKDIQKFYLTTETNMVSCNTVIF